MAIDLKNMRDLCSAISRCALLQDLVQSSARTWPDTFTPPLTARAAEWLLPSTREMIDIALSETRTPTPRAAVRARVQSWVLVITS